MIYSQYTRQDNPGKASGPPASSWHSEAPQDLSPIVSMTSPPSIFLSWSLYSSSPLFLKSTGSALVPQDLWLLVPSEKHVPLYPAGWCHVQGFTLGKGLCPCKLLKQRPLSFIPPFRILPQFVLKLVCSLGLHHTPFSFLCVPWCVCDLFFEGRPHH